MGRDLKLSLDNAVCRRVFAKRVGQVSDLVGSSSALEDFFLRAPDAEAAV